MPKGKRGLILSSCGCRVADKNSNILERELLSIDWKLHQLCHISSCVQVEWIYSSMNSLKIVVFLLQFFSPYQRGHRVPHMQRAKICHTLHRMLLQHENIVSGQKILKRVLMKIRTCGFNCFQATRQPSAVRLSGLVLNVIKCSADVARVKRQTYQQFQPHNLSHCMVLFLSIFICR